MNVAGGNCLNYGSLNQGQGNGPCPPRSAPLNFPEGGPAERELVGPMPVGETKPNELYAATNGDSGETVEVAVIDYNSGATLIKCSLKENTRMNSPAFCKNAGPENSATEGDYLEVKINTAGAHAAHGQGSWRVTFRR